MARRMSGRIGEAAQTLLAVYDKGEPCGPLTERYEDLTLDEAYQVQLEQVRQWNESGRVLRGHKVGLTSRAMQQQLGVDQPDYGHLFADMFHAGDVPVDVGRYIAPRIEPEIAFVLGRPLKGPGVTVPDAVRAVEFVLPALEIIDSRIRDWRITLVDTIADNASSGGIVLGAQPSPLSAADLATVGCNLFRNGRLADTGTGGAVLGHPLRALVWLANTLGGFGVTLREGDVVLPGSCTTALPVTPGDVFQALFDGLGSVSVEFSAKESP